MNIDIRWRIVRGPKTDPAWRWSRVLYAYLDPMDDEVLYIGKADGTKSTVRSRWRADDKDGMFEFFEREGIDRFVVLVGQIYLARGERLTRELLLDIETLLIQRVRPRGNIMATRTRISRPGMTVRCLGRSWPERREFRDR